MQVQYDRMIEHDINYKKKMTQTRKKGGRSKSISRKVRRKSNIII